MNSASPFRKYASAIALAAVAAVAVNAVAAGEILNWANTGTSYQADNANGSRWTLRIPAAQSLPANTIVSISSISIGSRNTSFTADVKAGDASSITIVDVEGNTVRSSVISAFNGTIQANASTTANRLTYNFPSGVKVRVGADHSMTLCKSDGAILEILDSADSYVAAGARVINVPDPASSVLNMNLSAQTSGGWVPVYEISGTVEILPAETTLAQDASISQLVWSPAMQGGLQSAQINVTASSTLTMDTTLSASRVRLNVPAGVVLTLSGSTVIAATSFDVAGGGEVVFSGALPGDIAVDPSWTGTNTILGVSGITGSNCDFNAYGNASSAVKLTGVSGWVNAQHTYSVPVVLDDGGYGYALKLTDGLSPQSMDYSSGANLNRCTVFSKVSGSGTITDDIAGSAWPVVKIYDASEFAGLVSVSRASIVFCTAAGDATLNGSTLFDLFNSTLGSIYIASDVSVALAPQKDWHGATGFAGSGEVLCEGRLPPANMFTNATWKGTAKISNVASLKDLDLGLYGNSSSSIELAGMGSAEGNQSYFKENATFPGRLVLKDDGDTKALVLNNGYSDGCVTIGELAGDGTLVQVNAGISQGITVNAMTNFTGTLALNKMTVTFGTATRSRATPDAQSKLFIDQDALISVPAGFELWSPGEIVIDGQVDFTTSETNYRQLVLFANLGDSIMLGENAVFTVNGKEFNPDRYYLQPIGTSLVLKKFPGTRFIFR